ncbi:TRAP transporter large permease [Mameliella sediminis]|uniref:TRAP transporter large permease n=1 Tax=Mameliella sediminis TaxID=2836866 RepID=UPI001C46E2CF|nr:TRAP transporter large permease [Mameliella sediminis]MBV7395939.1 TRAP transporter large permease [Mameliella sediminis]MBY6144824.1 TRAP transporter large permease [Mameliella alba]MCA0956435.1 TRAP transporter large permease [Mameliella alba]
MELWVLFGTLVITLIIGLPLPFSMGIASVAALMVMDLGIPLVVVPQRMIAGIDNFAFMAIPFFLLVGELMNTAGITQRIINLSNALVGHIAGGLAQVNVVSSMFFGGMSGSSTADTASIGSILIPAMKKEGYDADFSVALTATSACCGPLIPPSIGMILYGVIANVSVTKLFLAGYVPGLMLGFGLLLTSYLISKKRGYPTHPRASVSQIWTAFTGSVWAAALPFLIIIGLLSGIFTVTEAACVAVVYTLFVGLVVYRELRVRDLPGIFMVATVKCGTMMSVAAAALIFAWVLTVLEVPQALATAILGVSENKYVILLLLNVFFLFIGTFMEPKASMLILLPVLLPVVPEFGIDLIHFGIIFIFNALIGLITPPVGIVLNLAAKIGGVSIDKAAIASLPFLGTMLLILMIITYVPAIILWLPGLL